MEGIPYQQMDAMHAIWADHIYELSLRYKTEVCWAWQRNRGACEHGWRCTFAHGARELRTTAQNKDLAAHNKTAYLHACGYCPRATENFIF